MMLTDLIRKVHSAEKRRGKLRTVSHASSQAVDTNRNAGFKLLYLSPYTPDLAQVTSSSFQS